ncbi:MAG: sigma-54 dependent transcriptional regulator [Alphaproteobacteria bacterium]|nr:sigma-54 dependent transcriptional regulator [Alphaproteobacteria bacterium]
MTHDILVVDDEEDIRMLIAGVLNDEGYATREAGDSDTALSEINHRRPSLVILDIWLQGSDLDGLEILNVLREDYPDIPVIMISGHGNVETAVAAIKRGAYDYIEKPFKSDRLLHLAERAIETARLRRENLDLRQRAGGDIAMVGSSAAIRQVRAAISQVAPTGSRVLISGPAGSGKEVAARLIHAESARAAGPFVAINCASMHPDRLAEVLFGTEGADQPRRTGLFEAAHNGTLFLDEVGDMPIETQGKIVRVLQEQTFERVGGSSLIEVDVRVIAATSRDLEREMELGHFREDLYYRLAVVPIAIPPLDRRREDISELVEHFMERAAQSSGLTGRVIGDDVLAALRAHDWPGNVRQLRNVVERLLIMAPRDADGMIHADSLPPEFGGAGPTLLRGDSGSRMMGLDLRAAREMFEREYLSAQIQRFGGNVSRTAQFVGMERSALHRKLKTLGLGSDGGEREKTGT